MGDLFWNTYYHRKMDVHKMEEAVDWHKMAWVATNNVSLDSEYGTI